MTMFFVEIPADASLADKQKVADLLSGLGVSPNAPIHSAMGTGALAIWFEVTADDENVVLEGVTKAGLRPLGVADIRGVGLPQGGQGQAPRPAGAAPPQPSAPRPAGVAPTGPLPPRPPVPSVSGITSLIPPPMPGGGRRLRNTPPPPPQPVGVEEVEEVEEVEGAVAAPEVVVAPEPAPVAADLSEPEPEPEPSVQPPEHHEVFVPPTRWSLKDADAVEAELAHVLALENDDSIISRRHDTGARIRLGTYLGTARWQRTDGTYTVTVHPDAAASDEGEFLGQDLTWPDVLEALRVYAIDTVAIYQKRVERSREQAEKKRKKKTPDAGAADAG